MQTIKTTQQLGLTPTKQGKVRDIFDLGDKLVIIATDRISVFDVVLPDPIPYKGIVLTQLTKFWCEYLKDIIENHIISFGVDGLSEEFKKHKDILELRTMVVKKAKVLPIECIVRGYLSGSGLKEYQRSKTVCGIKLPEGLKESSKLPQPIFTPSTKAELGHDENITFEKAAEIIGKDKAEFIKQKSIELYKKAAEYAETRGIIIADTKFEFGIEEKTEKIILIDEILTPDSSRFWPKDKYEEGKPQPSLDKQYVRDYTESTGWNKTYPGPNLPQEVIETTSKKYREI
ncbi:MAG: phosphoribosylaminoimidazolesuccinocarboxamide synthase, partial [Endomicrobia bacterium]|nr:phosphoribosylaminoimidazolesuccinocarboxamide synthase [Endomicrobiia bacterium]